MIEMKRQLILQISLSKIMKKRNIEFEKIKASKDKFYSQLNSSIQISYIFL